MRQAEHAYTTPPEQAAERQRLRVLRNRVALYDAAGGEQRANAQPRR